MNQLFRTPLEKRFEIQSQRIKDAVENAIESSITFEEGVESRMIATNISEVTLKLSRLYQIAHVLPTILSEVREPKFGTVIDNKITLTYYFEFVGESEFLEYMPKENPVNPMLMKEMRYTESSIEIDIQPHGTDFSPDIMMNLDNGMRSSVLSIRKILLQTAQEIDSFNYNVKSLIYNEFQEQLDAMEEKNQD